MAASEPVDFDTLWDYDHPAETELRFRTLLPGAQQTNNTAYHLELLTQIARAQGLQRNFVQAHQTLDEVQRLLTDDQKRARIRYLLERGRVFNSSGAPTQAHALFLPAWEAALAAGEDFYAIDAAHMLAIVEPAEAQLAWNLKALELAQNSSDARARQWLGSLYNNIGWTYHDMGQYERALTLFEQALAFRQTQGQPTQIRIAAWCVARVLRSLGRLEEALARQRQLLDEHERAGSADGYVFEELAECLLSLGRHTEARPYFTHAYTELAKDPWLVEREPARLERLKQLSESPSA